MNPIQNNTPQVFLFKTLKEEIDLGEQELREDSLQLFDGIADAWLYTLHRWGILFEVALAVVQYREYDKWKRVEFKIHDLGRVELISIESKDEMEVL